MEVEVMWRWRLRWLFIEATTSMFHDSGNFCHCGLSLKVTPAAVEEEEEVHAAELFCCVETLFMFMCFFIFFPRLSSTFIEREVGGGRSVSICCGSVIKMQIFRSKR